MKHASKLLLTVTIAFLSLNASANCSLAAIIGAPEIPSAAETSFDAVAELRSDVDKYIARASDRLERCSSISDPFLYNVAVEQLNRVAADYNSLVRSYNSQVALLAN